MYPRAKSKTQVIFLFGMSRGGTNQLLNILRSHPETFWPEGEFAEVFRKNKTGKFIERLRRFIYYSPLRLFYGDILAPNIFHDNIDRKLLGWPEKHIQRCLLDSCKYRKFSVEKYRKSLEKLGLIDLIPKTRLFVKAVDYNLELLDSLHRIFPEAIFIGLIRDGRAVCEGHIARGKTPLAAAQLYNFVGNKLASLEKNFNGRTWRFEDLISDPERVIYEIIDFCSLDLKSFRGVMLQDKHRTYDVDGTLKVEKVDKYFSMPEIKKHFRQDVNAHSIGKLNPKDLEFITNYCYDTLKLFDYI